MIVYHGSFMIIEEPKIIYSNRAMDFGEGFYTTSDSAQAIEWARIGMIRRSYDKAILNIYELDLVRASQELKILKFEGPSQERLDFVIQNRLGGSFHDFDTVIGCVADDNVYRVINSYEENEIDYYQAIQKLKTEKLVDQILFHTEKALKYLKFIGYEEVSYES